MKLDHIGVAVRSLEQALEFYREHLGMEFAGIESVPAEKVRVAMLLLADTRVELLEPTAEDSPIARFIAKRGVGIHHIALTVRKLDAHLQRLEAAGVKVVPGRGQTGAGGHRYAFLHPSSCGGVLIELVEETQAEAKEPE